MLEIYRQALNAGALPTARPRSTESAHSSERCPSHDSNSSENGRVDTRAEHLTAHNNNTNNNNFPAVPQNLPAHPPSMEAYLQMVAAAAQQYGFPLGAAAAAAVAASPTIPLPDLATPFKLPAPQASPTASSNNSEALDFRTHPYGRSESAEPAASEEDEEFAEEEEDTNDANNPLDLSVGPRKRAADTTPNEPDSTIGKIQVKKLFKTENLSMPQTATTQPTQLLPPVNPYLAAVAAANIFRSGQFPDWNGKSDLVVDPLEKMSDIVKGPRKEKLNRPSSNNQISVATPTNTNNSLTTPTAPSVEPLPKTRHNIWQSHWQNKGVASSVFRCVWCKQSFPTLEALTTHMKDSKHCGVNVPPFSNLPNTTPTSNSTNNTNTQHNHNLRKHNNTNDNNTSSPAVKNAFQYRGDPPTPLPRKLVRGQNVWLGKGVEQAMQILKCMRCGESFRSLGEMTKHMQETQHYTNILSQEQTISMKSNSGGGDNKDGQSLSSEESRTLSAVLTCKVCDKAFNSLGDLSNHMAKNNHYAEPLMQSLGGGSHRKRPAPKKREKSLPVRKLLEMKADNSLDSKSVRAYDGSKRLSIETSAEKNETALFAERMRQYISGVKAAEDNKNNKTNDSWPKTKSPEVELKNGNSKSGGTATGSNSVLSAIEHMFTTSFDTPLRHANLPATSPSNSSTKNTSPVASSILKRLGIDETVDYNKPLVDTTDPYYQQYRYTSSERSGSECSAEIQVETKKKDCERENNQIRAEKEKEKEREKECEKSPNINEEKSEIDNINKSPKLKLEIKAELQDDETKYTNFKSEIEEEINETPINLQNGNDESNGSRIRNSPKSVIPRSPTESQRSLTPKSPASSIKSYDGEKKYPSDSLNALSSMFDSLGSTTPTSSRTSIPHGKVESPENSLSALRQFCVKKEKTA